ncbi:MAG: O-antigen ligase family protein [Acidobacteria bacterium]|nr:O-antigen ligase family protein [Acidobacteriota bacterium]
MNPVASGTLLAARWLAFASAVSVLFSIAASQILLALALAALLFSEARLRLPPVWLPLAVFFAATLVSIALSAEPSLANPQIRKIFVFLMLPVLYSALRDLATLRRLYLCLFAAGAIVALRAMVQFFQKVEQAHAAGRSFYDFYVAERVTGAMSHWMTFGGQQMTVLLMLAAYLLFARDGRRRAWWLAPAAGAIALAILLGFTRTIWGAAAIGGLYLLWRRKRLAALMAPLLAALLFFAAPPSLRTRFESMVRPRKGIDSNEFRYVCRRIGYEMIRQHPWFGIGPEQVKAQYLRYVPDDVPRPLPEGWYGHLHNIYIHYAAERGIPALLALVWLLVKILLDFRLEIRKLPPGPSDRRFLLEGGVAVVLATMAAGLFELNLGDSEVLTLFLVVVASGYLAREAEPELA